MSENMIPDREERVIVYIRGLGEARIMVPIFPEISFEDSLRRVSDLIYGYKRDGKAIYFEPEEE